MSGPLKTLSIPLLAAGLMVCGGCAQETLGSKWGSHTAGLPFVVGYERGLQKAQQENKPVMFFVTTTWCGWCKKLARENFTNPSLRETLQENFVLVIVDGDTESEALNELDAHGGFPTVVFQTPSGETIEKVVGYRPLHVFKPTVDAVLRTYES